MVKHRSKNEERVLTSSTKDILFDNSKALGILPKEIETLKVLFRNDDKSHTAFNKVSNYINTLYGGQLRAISEISGYNRGALINAIGLSVYSSVVQNEGLTTDLLIQEIGGGKKPSVSTTSEEIINDTATKVIQRFQAGRKRVKDVYTFQDSILATEGDDFIDVINHSFSSERFFGKRLDSVGMTKLISHVKAETGIQKDLTDKLRLKHEYGELYSIAVDVGFGLETLKRKDGGSLLFNTRFIPVGSLFAKNEWASNIIYIIKQSNKDL